MLYKKIEQTFDYTCKLLLDGDNEGACCSVLKCICQISAWYAWFLFFFFVVCFTFVECFKKSCLSAFDLKTINTQSWSFQPFGLDTCILHRLFWVNSQKVLYLTIILVHVLKYWILGIFFIRYVNSYWLCQSKTFHTHWSYMYILTVITTFLHSVFTWYQYTLHIFVLP